MKLSDILGSINRTLDLQTDIFLQQLILTALWTTSSRLRRNEISILELISLLDEKLKSMQIGKSDISSTDISNLIGNLSRYPIDLDFSINGDVLSFKIKHSELDINIPEMRHFGEEIKTNGIFKGLDYTNILKTKQEEIEKLRHELDYFKNIETRFLATSSLTDKREIWDEATKIISNAKEKVYLMIAFYEEDLAFERLLISIAMRNVDLKILYRHNEEDNLRLVEKLRQEIQKKSAFKEYTYRNLWNSEMRYIGYLHSKMVLTENFLLIGSANLTTNSKKSNEESAIMTNDPTAIDAATNQFLEIWGSFYQPD